MVNKLLVGFLFVLACGQAEARFTEPITGSFYDQFIFQSQGNCKQISTVWFHSTSAWEPAELGKDPKGRREQAVISLQLFQDGTYYAAYEEQAVESVTSQGTRYYNIFEKVVQGQWTVTNNQIIVNGIGVGTPAKIRTSNGGMIDSFKLQMNTVLNDARVLKTSMNISRVITNVGPKGISINKYCHVN